MMLVKTARNIIGTGKNNGNKEARIISTKSSPLIFPNSLRVNVKGLARWVIISSGNIKGVSHHIGPVNDFIYFIIPCLVMPM